MINTYFGDIKNGRLQRLPFIGYMVLLNVAFIALMLAGAASLGVVENLVGGDLTQTQQMLAQKLGIPAMIVIFVVYAAVSFGSLNLTAKRIRDMGLPGWWTLLAMWILSIIIIVLLTGLLSPELGNPVSSIISAIVFLALVLVPSDTFDGNIG